MKLGFEKRTVTGKKVAALRKQGQTPGICYGMGEESKPYSINTKELLAVLASETIIIETEGDLSGKQVILQHIDFHPVSGLPVHADFLFVDAKQEVEHEVPVQVVGEAPGEKIHGGQLIVTLDRVNVRALPQNIPTHFDADVTALEAVGSHLFASDLSLPDGVTLVTSPDEIVVAIVDQSQEDEETHETSMDDIEVVGKGGKKESDDSEDHAEN